MNPFGRTRLLGFTLLGVTFVAGALAGAAVDRIVDDVQPDEQAERSDDEERVRPHIIDRLDLSETQRAAIDSILRRRSQRMRAIWHEVEPRMDAITDSTRSDIMSILTADQQAEYERMLEWRKKRDDRDDRDRRDDDRGDNDRDRSDPDPGDQGAGGSK